jgi:hypothetical protein
MKKDKNLIVQSTFCEVEYTEIFIYLSRYIIYYKFDLFDQN